MISLNRGVSTKGINKSTDGLHSICRFECQYSDRGQISTRYLCVHKK